MHAVFLKWHEMGVYREWGNLGTWGPDMQDAVQAQLVCECWV
jgi:hypothetical protein